MTLTDAQIAAIRERAAKATPGPWGIGNTSPDQRMVLGENGEGRYVCSVQIWQTPRAFGLIEEPQREANAAFIAAAITDIPALLAALEEARGALRCICEPGQTKATIVELARATLGGE